MSKSSMDGGNRSIAKIIAASQGGDAAWLDSRVTNPRQRDTKPFHDSVERPPEARLDVEAESERAQQRVQALNFGRGHIRRDRRPALQETPRSRRRDTKCNGQGSRAPGR